MIRHIFKIIWTERKLNLWILLELILVFCVLWFCVEFLSFELKRYFQPTGFDIENVYSIGLSTKDDGQVFHYTSEEKKDSLFNYFWTICDRIKPYPEIENMSVSYASVPYSPSYISTTYHVDTLQEGLQIKMVTPDFFKVFKLELEKGRIFEWDESKHLVLGNNNGVADKEGLFFKSDVFKLDTIYSGYNDIADARKVVGVVNRSKRGDYEPYGAIAYEPLKRNEGNLIGYIAGAEISVRVKSGSEKGFEERFAKNMQDQLSIGPYYLSSVQSFKVKKERYNSYKEDELKGVLSIIIFILINIFLGVVGTFWFRVQTRTSEVGLRVALGSSKNKIKAMFIIEALVLLFLASIIASVLCVNLALSDVLQDMDLPYINDEANTLGFLKYIENYFLTFIFLAIISVVAVWYPAKKASDVPPTEALRDE